jgi:predicted aspartyl protease
MKLTRPFYFAFLFSTIGAGITGIFQLNLASFAQSNLLKFPVVSPQPSAPASPFEQTSLPSHLGKPAFPQPPHQILTQLAQQSAPPNPNANTQGQALLQELIECVSLSVPTGTIPTLDELQVSSTKCVFQVVVLAPDGSIRADANERMIALIQATGVTLPKPITQGQAAIKLTPIPEQNLLSVSVILGDKPRRFLLDTGASNSIVDQQITQQLGLEGSPIPNELLTYMVVGDNCADVSASLHEMPAMRVDQATAEGITGLGLPKTAIPGQASGVLGLDFISGFDMILNPQTLELQLLPPSPSTPDAIPLQGKMGIMTTQVSINGQGTYTFLLDTGADTMVISEALSQKLSLDPAEIQETEVKGFCGIEKGKKTVLKQVQLQDYQVPNLDVVILESEVLKLLGVDGIVGQNFLNQFQQHWRFGPRNELGFPNEGSLVLTAF